MLLDPNLPVEVAILLHKLVSTGLPQHVMDLLVGTLLGDAGAGSISNVGTASIKFEQGLLHKEYLYFLFGVMAQWATRLQPTFRAIHRKRYNTYDFSYWFLTKQKTTFFQFVDLFYVRLAGRSRVKVLPWCIYYLLNPVSMAYWIMDDGQFVERGGVSLCTDNFTAAEVLALKAVINARFGFQCRIHNEEVSKGTYNIYIGAEDLRRLRVMVEPYMVPSMVKKVLPKTPN
jgi:hypothetical protein